MKFSALQGLVLNTITMVDWLFLLLLVLMVIVGGFSYLRVLYTLVTENQHLGLQLVYWPYTKNDPVVAAVWFVLVQLLAIIGTLTVTDVINVNLLLTQSVLMVS